jgi:predicted DNA-binding transcriptional regulator YafY
MSAFKYIERLKQINTLISYARTGTPVEFAKKLNIKRSTLFYYLQEMKEAGLDIKYSAIKQSYYYLNEKRLLITIIDEKTIDDIYHISSVSSKNIIISKR